MIIAGTGHRPHICPCGYNENHLWLHELKTSVRAKLVELGVTRGIAGGALGFDTWLAECILDCEIPLSLYIPFRGQGEKWPTNARNKYFSILDRATEVKYISDSYHYEAFNKRDRAMIDDCEQVFSLLSPDVTSGGTHYTVNYAKQFGKTIHNFWES